MSSGAFFIHLLIYSPCPYQSSPLLLQANPVREWYRASLHRNRVPHTPPSLAGQALAFMVFVRNLGNILGITVGAVTFLFMLAERAGTNY